MSLRASRKAPSSAVSTVLQPESELGRELTPEPLAALVTTDGKFLRAGGNRFFLKGVTYGTFAPDAEGYQFPDAARLAEDFALMRRCGINTVRVYTAPRRELLDEAARHGLRVMVGLPWSQHVAFLDDRRLKATIVRESIAQVRRLAGHPALLMFALGNEIPPGVVRWHGRLRVERFLRRLYNEAKAAAPNTLLTYVNFPPTEFLDLSFFDVLAFNVYLHRESDLRAYLARLQHVAGHKPLLLAEAGADSIREGAQGQAHLTAMHLRAAFEEGACGAVAFAWTDEWWRGGLNVDDWAFGLVDRHRTLKPAAEAVATVYADAPFSANCRQTWPLVSVVVCAYNAADTLDDCLSALERLTYPSYEVIVVNDGSRDHTGEIARGHSVVRLIDVPNGGLSAARNIGLSHSRGEIVAYTDADTRVDQDWLTFLVQPFLTLDVVGSGGPNVVPADDPPMAQCIARAPGGPTHVLLDDRIAEHVPGCNMAFRRDALLAINGFNPIYLRAGDDVDVCWRLQARGGKIGFAASALVWHHHRASIKAYWRQQVGYGEGERWLMAHHPEKFLDGRMQWRGRIYSPLPFVRSLWGMRVNAGVWGTAAFPSVYRTDVPPFAFLPHSINWQVLSFVLAVAGAIIVGLGGHAWSASLLLGTGLVGIAATLQKNIAYALRSDVSGLPGRKVFYRVVVAYLHFLQPFARMWGLIRGVLSPPEVSLPVAEAQTSRGPRPSWRDAWRALLLGAGSVTEDRFWSESWTSADAVLNNLTDWLRRSHAVRRLEIDEGWSVDRDVSILVGRWSWLDVRALVEEHHGGRVLLRLSTHLRPTAFGLVGTSVLAAALLSAAAMGLALRWPLAGAGAAVLVGSLVAFAAFRVAQATTTLRHGVAAVTTERGMTALKSGPAHLPLLSPSLLRAYGLRSATVATIALVAIATGTLLLREAATAQVIGARKGYGGDNGPVIEAWLDTPGGIVVAPTGELFLADSNNHVIRRIDAANKTISTVVGNNALGPGFSGDFGPATTAQLDTPDGVAIAPDGDLIVADSHNHRVRRVDRETGDIATIAGSGRDGFSGDEGPATQAELHTPSAVAAASNGDIYIADTLNYRVRMIDHVTGFIHTIAGTGAPGDEDAVGDGGPATAAQLNMPSDIALGPTGDLYIADMHHQRVRRIDASTRIIATVAGTGRWGYTGDGGPAVAATLAGPAGITVVSEPTAGVTLYIADYYNGRVRAVGPDGAIREVRGAGREGFGAPTRVAFAPERGWLYVADSNRDRLVVLTVRPVPPRPAALPEAPVPVARPTSAPVGP